MYRTGVAISRQAARATRAWRGISVASFSAPPFDERLIEHMFQSSLDALRSTREQIFGFAEAGRDEENRLVHLLEQVQAETEECIKLVDKLEAETRAARE